MYLAYPSCEKSPPKRETRRSQISIRDEPSLSSWMPAIQTVTSFLGSRRVGRGIRCGSGFRIRIIYLHLWKLKLAHYRSHRSMARQLVALQRASKKFDVWTTVLSDETDASAVALGITQAVMEFDQKHCANRDRRAAQYETLLRRKLAAIRDAAMELQAALEFAHGGDALDDEVWKFSDRTVRHAEEIMRNQRGELCLPEPE